MERYDHRNTEFRRNVYQAYASIKGLPISSIFHLPKLHMGNFKSKLQVAKGKEMIAQ